MPLFPESLEQAQQAVQQFVAGGVVPGTTCEVAATDYFIASFQKDCAVFRSEAYNSIESTGEIESWMDCDF